jgi:hypothetical protein
VIRLTATILPLLLLILVACAALLSACGGGSSSSSTSTSATESSAVETGGAAEGGGGGAEFRVPGGAKQEVNRIIAGSMEASAGERAAASVVLGESFEARAAKDWAAQCATLSTKMVKVVRANSAVVASNESCAESLAAAGAKASKQALADPMKGTAGALRLVGRNQAFAFFHGADGRDYLIPMEDEAGDWKVASLTAEPIPGS